MNPRLKDSLERMSVLLALIVALALVDAVCSGGITWLLSRSGWNRYSQNILDLYQLLFGAFCLVLIYLFDVIIDRRFVFSLLVLLAAYVEDVLYYPLLPIGSIFAGWLTRNNIQPPTEWPTRIAGWIGWVSRTIFNGNFHLSTLMAIFVAFSTIGLVFLYNYFHGDDK